MMINEDDRTKTVPQTDAGQTSSLQASGQPASPEPASGQPASLEPASGQPASLEPASGQPASLEPASGRAEPPASPRAAGPERPGGQPEDEPIEQIGRAMARMRLMIGRRFIGQLALRRLGAGMELSHLDVISIIRRNRDSQEVTVGMIAEQMRIDPSRGSRVVADLVKRGVLKRQASQQDARRTVVETTPMGEALIRQIDEVKRETLETVVGSWSAEDRAAFGRLYERFVDDVERRYREFEGAEAGRAEDADDATAQSPMQTAKRQA